jgi:hypothetical protein
MKEVIFYGVAALAGFLAICPGGRKPPCPDPIAASLWGLVMGGLAGVAYYFLFLGKRALESWDLLAVALVAFLLSHFIWIFFFAKREA